MGVYHLISISEDELRAWRGDHDELLRNIGAAVVLACLDPASRGVCIQEAVPDESEVAEGQAVTVTHVYQHEGSTFAVWAWEAGDSVCVADLEDRDLETLGNLVEAVRRGRI